MKIIILLFITVHYLFNPVFAQTNINWQRSLGGTSSDAGYSIVTTRDNGLIATGVTFSVDGDITVSHGNGDYWVVKLDSNGIMQWQKSYGGSGSDFPLAIINTNDSGYIFCGTSASNDFDITNNHGGNDCWIVKTDSLGTIEWQKSYGGTLFDRADCIQQTNDNGFIVCGTSQSNNGDVTGNHGASDVWIFKIDSIGNLIWQKSYGGTSYEISHTVNPTIDGGFILGCNTSSNNGDVSGNHGADDIWIFKIDSVGNLVWQKTFGGSWMENQSRIIQDSNGNYFVSGFTSSTDGDITTYYGYRDAWLLKLDSLGNLLWQKSYGGSSGDEFYDILIKNNNEIFICGLTESNDIDLTGNHGGTDGWLVKIDSTGNIISQKCFGGSQYENFISLKFNLSFHGLYVAGRNTSIDGDVIGNHGGEDIWILKLAPDSSTGIISELRKDGISIYPNPFTTNISITIYKRDLKIVSYQIYDIFGNTVLRATEYYSGTSTKTIDLGSISRGIYLLEVIVDGERSVQKIIRE